MIATLTRIQKTSASKCLHYQTKKHLHASLYDALIFPVKSVKTFSPPQKSRGKNTVEIN